MNFGNQQLIKKMNNLMLKYADDIVSVDRKHITDFFDGIDVSYRENYIDFLSLFGGNCSDFFQTNEFNCTFQEIKDLYLENAIYAPLPPKGYCLFSNQIVEDCYIIENSSGYIYQEGYYNDENQYIIGKLLYESLDEFVWERLFSTYNNNISTSVTEVLDKKNIEKFLSSLKKNKLFDVGCCHYFFKENIIYTYYQNDTVIYKYIIDDVILKTL